MAPHRTDVNINNRGGSGDFVPTNVFVRLVGAII